MHSYAFAFNQNLARWQTQAVHDMSEMFTRALAFNQGIGRWVTRSTTSLDSMFMGASVFYQDLDTWEVGAVSADGQGQVFDDSGLSVANYCKGACNKASFSPFFAAYNVPSASVLKKDVVRWVSSPTTTWAEKGEINTWNTERATDMSEMFSGQGGFNDDINGWRTDAATAMRAMFQGASLFNINLKSWQTTAVQDWTNAFTGTVSLSNCNKLSMYRAWMPTNAKFVSTYGQKTFGWGDLQVDEATCMPTTTTTTTTQTTTTATQTTATNTTTTTTTTTTVNATTAANTAATTVANGVASATAADATMLLCDGKPWWWQTEPESCTTTYTLTNCQVRLLGPVPALSVLRVTCSCCQLGTLAFGLVRAWRCAFGRARFVKISL